MTCKHEHLKCTDNKLFCMDCGAELPLETLYKQEKQEAEEKKPAKRRTKKGAE